MDANAERRAQLLKRLKENGREREKLLYELEAWETVTQRGHSVENVEGFSFRGEFCSVPEKIAVSGCRDPDRQIGPRWSGEASKLWINCVILKDGSVRGIGLHRRWEDEDSDRVFEAAE